MTPRKESKSQSRKSTVAQRQQKRRKFFLTSKTVGAKKAAPAKKLASGLFEKRYKYSREARMNDWEAACKNSLTA
jgi:hypothetical protein